MSEMLHDCADWSRVLSNKRLCKHVAKLLLTIDREKASETLRRIDAERHVAIQTIHTMRNSELCNALTFARLHIRIKFLTA